MKSNDQLVKEPINLAFNRGVLEALIDEGRLHATDFYCLDSRAKSSVWQILRSVAARSLRLS